MSAAKDALTCFMGDLPDELLVAIASQLRVERGFVANEDAEQLRRTENSVFICSLYALSLSCRKLNAIATPLLYQCIIQTESDPHMFGLLGTLISKPQLARYIQYMEFDDLFTSAVYTESERLTGCIFAAQWLRPLPDSSTNIRICVERLQRTGLQVLNYQETEELALCQAIEHALDFETSFSAFAVLVSMADNLEGVALPYTFPPVEKLVLSLLALRRYVRPEKFRWLWLDGEVSAFALRVMVGKPSEQHGTLVDYLRKLLLSQVERTYPGPPIAMERISLDVYDVDAEDIGKYLRNCCSVERFSCRWKWTDQFVPEKTVDLPCLRKSLLHIQSTLSHLAVDTMESAWRVDIDTIIPAFGSLRNFNALKHLDVAGLVLWGDDDTLESPPLSALLPESLETLVLKTEWDDDVEDAFHRLSMDCTDLLPNLKKIDCTWRPAPQPVGEHLVEAFQLLGVDLVLDICGYEDT